MRGLNSTIVLFYSAWLEADVIGAFRMRLT
jgi:hypothetical protein